MTGLHAAPCTLPRFAAVGFTIVALLETSCAPDVRFVGFSRACLGSGAAAPIDGRCEPATVIFLR